MARYSVVADLHCHTLASTHAYSTVTELANAAAAKGLVAVGCTDHGIGNEDAPHIWHFDNLDILPDTIAGVRVLRGVEANVVDHTGRLDMPRDVLGRLELVIASMHRGVMTAGSVEECTAAWLAVARDPLVTVIGHPGQTRFPFEHERVIPEFGRGGKAVEINAGSFRVRADSVPNCRRIALLCKRYGVPVMVSSDAHYHAAVGEVSAALRMLEEIDFPPELIVNGDAQRLRDFLAQHGVNW